MMRVGALLLLALLLASLPATAQTVPPGFGGLHKSGPICPGSGSLCQPIQLPPAYVGVGDLGISGAVGFYGLRAWSNATTATKAANICNNLDANCADISSLSNGNFDVATAQAAPLSCGGSGGTCTVKTWYEQSGGGGGNLTQATAADRATLTFNCVNTTLPCALFGTNTIYTSAAGIVGQNTATFGIVFNDAAGGIGTQRTLFGFTSSTYQLRLSGGAGAFFCSPDTSNLNTVSTSVWHTGMAVCAALAGTYVDYLDNSSLTGGGATGAGFTAEVINFGQGGGSGNNDKITEAYVFTGAAGLTSGNATTINHNECLYWGTTGPC